MRWLLISLLATGLQAANFTYVSGAVATDGVTVTLNFTAPVSCLGLTPTSNVPGFSVYEGTSGAGAVYPTTTTATKAITAACDGGTAVTVTMVLLTPVRSGITVKGSWNYSSTSTLTDTAADTIAVNAAATLTNNSTVSATAFEYNNAAIKYAGRWTSGGTYVSSSSTDAQIEFQFTGTALHLNTFMDLAIWKYSIDGAAVQTLDVTASVGYNANANGLYPLATGLSDASHTATLMKNTLSGFGTTTGLVVQGASPALTIFTGYGSEYPISGVASTISPTLSTYSPTAGAPGLGLVDPGNGYGLTAETHTGGGLQFVSNSCTDIWLYVFRGGGSSWRAYVDGTLTSTTAIPSGTTTVGSSYSWLQLLTGLSGTKSIQISLYGTYPIVSTTAYVFSVMCGGAGTISTTTIPAKGSVTWLGDSLMASATTSTSQTSYQQLLTTATSHPATIGLPVYPTARQYGQSGASCATVSTSTAGMYIDSRVVLAVVGCGTNDAIIGTASGTVTTNVNTLLTNTNAALNTAGLGASVPILFQIPPNTSAVSQATLDNYRAYIRTGIANYNAGAPTHLAYTAETEGWISTATSAVSAATWSSGTATYTVGSTAGISALYPISVLGITPSGYNTISCTPGSITATQFTCPIVANPGAYSSGGTMGVDTTDGTHPNDGGSMKMASRYLPWFQRLLFGCRNGGNACNGGQ